MGEPHARLSYWALPGPRTWLRDVAQSLADGVVAVDIPESRRGIISSVFEAAAEEARFAENGYIVVDPEYVDLPPASAILEAVLDVESRPVEMSAKSLLSTPGMDGVVVWVEPRREDWRRWSIFVSSFLEERTKSQLIDPPSLVIVVPAGAERLDRRAPFFRFEGVIGREDTSLIYAQTANRRGAGISRVERLLAPELVVEIAGWDLNLARELSALSLENLLDPLAWYRSRPVSEVVEGACQKGGNDAGWHEGWLDLFDDRHFPSFGRLSQVNDVKTVRNRIWRAQIRGLFPWLEEIRQEVIQRYRGKFRLPLIAYDDVVIRDAEELDWGHIQYTLRGIAPQSEMDWFEVMKRIRNALAHRNTASFADIKEAERFALRFIAGR